MCQIHQRRTVPCEEKAWLGWLARCCQTLYHHARAYDIAALAGNTHVASKTQLEQVIASLRRVQMSHPDKEPQLAVCHPHGSRVVLTLTAEQSEALEPRLFWWCADNDHASASLCLSIANYTTKDGPRTLRVIDGYI